ncbi:MAG TPA: hypothetical protein EYP10_06770 [Armatimonadetes bacterium]|nr:hypothetical protein [Armatimonadota bacterium]
MRSNCNDYGCHDGHDVMNERMRFRVGEFYPESLIKAVEEVRWKSRWRISVYGRDERWVVKLWRVFIPVTIIEVRNKEVTIRSSEGWVVWEAYCARVERQEPLRQLIRDIRFAEWMKREFGEW